MDFAHESNYNGILYKKMEKDEEDARYISRHCINTKNPTK